MTDRKSLPDPAGRLRKLLDEKSCVIMPGCYDALSARLVERAGFDAAAISGFSVEVATLGCPDLGIMTQTELAAHAAKITGAVDIPVITDVDTGFGGVHNVARTVRELERAGIAGMHIEDQVNPKRCPALEGRQVVPIDEAVVRIQAAIEARQDNFVVIARCDADAVSYDELIKRCRRYLEAGADLVLPMLMTFNGHSVKDMSPDDQMKLYGRLVQDIDGPVMGLAIPSGYTSGDVACLGYKILAMPALMLEAAANAMADCLAEARQNGTGAAYFERNPKSLFAGVSLMRLMRLEQFLAFEDRLNQPQSPTPSRPRVP
jgi:methylisocitrate lyase